MSADGPGERVRPWRACVGMFFSPRCVRAGATGWRGSAWPRGPPVQLARDCRQEPSPLRCDSQVEADPAGDTGWGPHSAVRTAPRSPCPPPSRPHGRRASPRGLGRVPVCARVCPCVPVPALALAGSPVCAAAPCVGLCLARASRGPGGAAHACSPRCCSSPPELSGPRVPVWRRPCVWPRRRACEPRVCLHACG